MKKHKLVDPEKPSFKRREVGDPRMDGWIGNPTDKKQPSGIPVAGFAGKVLVHPSLICQICASDQGHFHVMRYVL
jgi:hypothetical protein